MNKQLSHVVPIVVLAAIPAVFVPRAVQAQTVLFVEGDRVSIGKTAPQAPLEIDAAGSTVGTGNSVILLKNPGGLAFQLDDTNVPGFWNFSAAAAETEFRISKSGTGFTELSLTSAGDLTIRGKIFTAGSCGMVGCDRVFASDYELPTIEEHAEQMWQHSYLPAIGPTPENGSMDLSDKTARMLNELEKAHIYIEQLNKEIKQRDARIADLEHRFDRLEALVKVKN